MIKDVTAAEAAQMMADMGRKCRVLQRWRDLVKGNMARVEVAGNGDAGQPPPPPPRKRGQPRKDQNDDG